MRIDLVYLLAKNKSTLKEFLAHHNINSYIALVDLCENRRFAVVSEEYYNKHSGTEVAQARDEKRIKEPQAPKATKNKAPATRRRRTSSSQKKQVSRTSSKKIKDT